MDKRSHQSLPDFGVGLHEGVHLVACHLDASARGTHTGRISRATEDQLMSPVNCAGLTFQSNLVQADGRITRARPAFSKNGTLVWRAVDQHFAAVIGRIIPERMQSRTIALTQLGNRSAAFGRLESSVERATHHL